jgi:hypothetical protein
MSDPIRWNPGVDRFDANPAATVVLDRAAWERIGAVFVEHDDGDDERPGLAVGEIETDGGVVEFGVLDYGEPETFLLVSGRDRAAVDAARAVLSALQGAGVLDLTTQLSDFSAGDGPALSRSLLEDRVSSLEWELATLRSAQETATAGLVGHTSLDPAVARAISAGELMVHKIIEPAATFEDFHESLPVDQLRLPLIVDAHDPWVLAAPAVLRSVQLQNKKIRDFVVQSPFRNPDAAQSIRSALGSFPRHEMNIRIILVRGQHDVED